MDTKRLFVGVDAPEGWLTISPHDHRQRLPFKNCSLDEVYVDHQLEKYTPDQIVEMLTEWRRVIRLGGQFTIAFTDIVRAVFLYQRSVISSEELDKVLECSNAALSKERLENLLIMRYSKVLETHQTLNEKQLWTTVLTARKEILS